MRKLKMDVDALVVESFETAAASREIGTVQGRIQQPVPQPTPPVDTSKIWSCNGTCVTCTDCNTCISCNSCFSCQGTCFDVSCATCGGESCGPTMCQLTFADGCCA